MNEGQLRQVCLGLASNALEAMEGRGTLIIRSRQAHGEVEIELEDVEIGKRVVAATVRYEAAGRVWRHPFRARLLDDDELAGELASAGLELMRTLDDSGAWLVARPILPRIVPA